MDLIDFGSIVRRWWPTLLVACIVAGICGNLIASNTAPTYEGRAELLVGPFAADNDTIKAAGSNALTYAGLVTTRPVVSAAASELNLRGSEFGEVTATANDVTRLLTITVDSEDRVVAADMANALAQQLIQTLGSGVVAGAPAAPQSEIQLVERASAPLNPVSPNVELITILSALAALVGTLGLILVIEYVDDAVRGRESLPELADRAFVANVGGLPRPTSVDGATLLVERDPGSPVVIALRLVATNVELALGEKPAAVLVTGVDHGEGSLEIAANVAAALVDMGKRVALVDTSLDRSVLRLLGVWDQRLAEDDWGLRALQLESGSEIIVTSAGGLGRIPVHDATDVERLLERLYELVDRVVVYASPLTESPGTLFWASATENALLVARRNQSKRSAVLEVTASFRRIGAEVIGVVLNERRLLEGPSRRSPLSGRGKRQRRGATELDVMVDATASVPDVDAGSVDNGARQPTRKEFDDVPVDAPQQDRPSA